MSVRPRAPPGADDRFLKLLSHNGPLRQRIGVPISDSKSGALGCTGLVVDHREGRVVFDSDASETMEVVSLINSLHDAGDARSIGQTAEAGKLVFRATASRTESGEWAFDVCCVEANGDTWPAKLLV